MLVAPPVSYPGVYIQEVQSDVRTIVGVETATTAFIGRARRGPTDQPMVCNSYADFERIFGGLWLESALGYAVRDFFLNGGSKAVVIRVYNPTNGTSGRAQFTIGDGNNMLTLLAKYPGTWGKQLAARVIHIATDQDIAGGNNKATVAKAVATQYGLEESDANLLFTLVIRDLSTGATEIFDNVTVNKGPRQIKGVLEQGSQLVEVQLPANGYKGTRPSMPLNPPDATKTRWSDPHTTVNPDDTSAKDGDSLTSAQILPQNGNLLKTGLYALEDADIFNLLCIPPYNGNDVETMKDVDGTVLTAADAYCKKRRAMLIIDPPSNPPGTQKAWDSVQLARENYPLKEFAPSTNAMVYFPRIAKANPLRDNQVEPFAPSGTIAGIMARTDATRGVWKAPAGLEASLAGVAELEKKLTDAENGELNPLGINCLRTLPAAGHVVWGARTTVGDDRLANQWKYIPVRRTALFIEETIYRNIQWAVFEPNDEPLWSQLRLNIGVFMHGLFRQGAFQGQSPKDAYFVKCDSTTTTQADIDKGIVNVVVGFAPLKPAEFVVVYIQQITGQLIT
ncbi:MAG TPA: phage tail sheath subtilisin-like domain-containing protein [Caldilineaceae bacterium]|nr:phage tail sheath subtilisin-like domain-containing protein [Caldilineaceae bacterium]